MVRGVKLQLMISFLSNRYQAVSLGNMIITWLPINCGVPQGTVFLRGQIIYSNSLLKLNVCSKIISFAVDIDILANNKTITDIYDSANYTLKIINIWFDNNFLELNSRK